MRVEERGGREQMVRERVMGPEDTWAPMAVVQASPRSPPDCLTVRSPSATHQLVLVDED